jgi:RNA polymerase sigma-70 factor, ECF subfamily
MNKSSGADDYINGLLDKYSDMVMRIAFSNLKNQQAAEDIFQEVFIKLMEKMPAFENQDHEKAWIIRVTINLCKNHLKTTWFRKTTALEENICITKDEQREVLEAVMELPIRYRNVVYLFYYEGYSMKEIAEILKQKQTTIGTWLYRARKLLEININGGSDGE